MKTIAIVTAFPPSAGSLNEYGFHLVNAYIARPDIEKIIVIADKFEGNIPELDLGSKVEVQRVWNFNSLFAGLHILKALKASNADGALYNLQTASFGDSEIPAALGLLTPAISQKIIMPSGVIMHNLVEAVDLSKTNLAKSPIRQKLVSAASYFVTKTMLMSGFMTVTLDSFWDILKDKYNAKNAFMVPHGSFPTVTEGRLPALNDRPNTIVTMGKFGTYKRLERTIGAVQSLNADRNDTQKIKLVIGGSDHPATPGYLQALADEHIGDNNIVFHGYIAEEDVCGFFTQAKLAIFDYDSTTGITMHTVASIQLQLLKKANVQKFNKVRRAKNTALHIQQNDNSFSAGIQKIARAVAQATPCARTNPHDLPLRLHTPLSPIGKGCRATQL